MSPTHCPRHVHVGLAALLLVNASGTLLTPQVPGVAAGGMTTPRIVMHALLEKTIFKVDVLTLRVEFYGEPAEAIDKLTVRNRMDGSTVDSIAQLAIHATAADAVIEFLRDVSLSRFLRGVDDNLRRAAAAGIITPQDYALVSDGLPRWFGFLAAEGIKRGDRIHYTIRGDTLRTRYLTRAGATALDQSDVGPERRLSVLGSYFAPQSDFRERLIGSLVGEAP